MFVSICKRTSFIIGKNRSIYNSWSLHVSCYTDSAFKPDLNSGSNELESDNEMEKPIKRHAIPQDYVILGARKSRIIPRIRRPEIKKSVTKLDAMEEQRKHLEQLFLDTKPQEDTLYKNLDSLRPLQTNVSRKRFDQLLVDLTSGFSKEQLSEYFHHKASSDTPKLKANATKKTIGRKILNNIWNLKKSVDISENVDVIVEKVLPLTKRELFLLLVNEQQLPRSWTKGGARLLIDFDDPKIVVYASADTFDWIQATVHNTLSTSISKSIDMKAFKEFETREKLPLDRIQRISRTYLDKDVQLDRLKAISSKDSNIQLAKRMLAQALPYSPRNETDFIYNTEPFKDNRLAQIADDDALSWIDRALTWFRLKKPREKDEIITRKMDDINSETITKLCNDLRNTKFDSKGRPTTLTATFGFLLHNIDSSGEKDPDLRQSRKIFSSNIPFLYNRSSKLPLFDAEADTAHEPSMESVTELSTESSTEPSMELSTSTESSAEPSTSTESSIEAAKTPPEEEETANDAWQKLLDITMKQTNGSKDEKPDRLVPSSKKRLERDDHAYLVQLKLVPNVFDDNGAMNLKKYPPIEMWFELDNKDRYVESSINFASTEEEISRIVSLPSWESDIKFTTSISNFLDSSQQSVQDFLDKSLISVHGNVPIHIPEYITLDMDGEQVEYIYQSMTYRRQIDLEYNGYIMQLSTLEGGGHGGRRIEANLVLHFPDGTEHLEDEEVRNFVTEAFSYAKSIAGQPVMIS